MLIQDSALWLIDGRQLPAIESVLRHLRANPTAPKPAAAGNRKPSMTTSRNSGISVLGLYGPIMYRNEFAEWMGGTDLARFVAEFEQAARESGTILIDIHSPGGEATFVDEAAQMIYESRSKVKTISFANAMACSAAHWLGSAASTFIATPSADLCSVGVYSTHLSYAGALEKEGIKATIMRAPAGKASGNPYEPLAPAARERFQQEVETLYEKFVNRVAKYRGLTTAKVKANFGGGHSLTAPEALAAGAIDRLVTPSALLAELASGQVVQTKRATTTTPTKSTSGTSVEVLRLRHEHAKRRSADTATDFADRESRKIDNTLADLRRQYTNRN